VQFHGQLGESTTKPVRTRALAGAADPLTADAEVDADIVKTARRVRLACVTADRGAQGPQPGQCRDGGARAFCVDGHVRARTVNPDRAPGCIVGVD
jgi:hypothetical protein